MVCSCSMAGTKTCWNCGNNSSRDLYNNLTMRVIENYDEKGQLIQRTFER